MNAILLKYLVTTWLFIHPYFVSMTEIEHDKKTNTLEISVRIFTDDLEKAIRKTYTGKVDLLNTKETGTSGKLIQQYVLQHLSIKADGKNLSLHFIGFNTEEGSIWSYYECYDVAPVKTLDVNNTILQDYQRQQINFIHVKAGSYDETIKLDYPDNFKEFVLN